MIEQVINKISEQQKGLEEYSAVYQVGEQLKDICRTTSGAAEIVLQDLELKEMSISAAEKKIKQKADELHKKHKGSGICITPQMADKIIREFYGIPDKGIPEQPRQTISEKSGTDDFISIFDM